MKFQNLSKVGIIAIITAAILLTVTTAAVLNTSQIVPLNGTVTAVNLALYTDIGLTTPCTTLNTGMISPGGTSTQTIYVKNTGTVPETLTMAVNGWNPSNASSVLTLSWDRQTYVLSAGQSIPATLTLTAAANTGSLTTFSCNVTFTGTQ
jgi:hypothetical protein